MEIIYPPRPEFRVLPKSLFQYEGKDWLAQAKLNGSYGVLRLEDGARTMFNRHGEVMTNVIDLPFSKLYRGSGTMILCGEYMNKAKKFKGNPWNHKFVVFDIIELNGERFTGTTLEYRLSILDELYGKESVKLDEEGADGTDYALYFAGSRSDPFYRCVSFDLEFERLFNHAAYICGKEGNGIYEGIVIKRKTARLEPCTSETSNSGWQLKSRVATKNYSF